MGKFVIKESAKGFSFALVASNGETIGVSEVYSAKATAVRGIESVKKNASIAAIEDQTKDETAKNPKFEVYSDKGGQFRFRLKASNGEIILASEAYKVKASALAGVESVRKNAPDATVA
ncbi:MAG: YegP family protein [Propionibacteriaceae bacterium]|jgi:uncharacterized protein YegP (UPF0339 family)|nr:YegP family protein [Propionibacteriaceae bacterium]